MKLMIIVVSDEYADEISSVLLKHNFMATEVGSTGDVLQYGDTVLLLGIREEQCDEVIAILKQEGHHSSNANTPYNNEVSIHVMDVSNYLKVNAANIIKDKLQVQ